MYKYISRPDCFYTDTDSTVLGSPLPEEEISSFELGMFKLENQVKKGDFLAPKSYALMTEDDIKIIKQKGPAKDKLDFEDFKKLHANPSQTKQIAVEAHFRIYLYTLNIAKREYQVNVGIKATKRDHVYDDNNVWVDTQPKNVIDFGGQESTILELELKLMKEEYDLKLAKKEKEIAKLREEKKDVSEAKLPEESDSEASEKASNSDVMRPLTPTVTDDSPSVTDSSPTGTEDSPTVSDSSPSQSVLDVPKPTLYNHPPKGEKKVKKHESEEKTTAPWGRARKKSG